MTEQIKLQMNSGEFVAAECTMKIGPMGVTKLPTSSAWRITHLLSGMCLPYRFETNHHAEGALLILDRRVSWNKMIQRLARSQKYKKRLLINEVCSALGAPSDGKEGDPEELKRRIS